MRSHRIILKDRYDGAASRCSSLRVPLHGRAGSGMSPSSGRSFAAQGLETRPLPTPWSAAHAGIVCVVPRRSALRRDAALGRGDGLAFSTESLIVVRRGDRDGERAAALEKTYRSRYAGRRGRPRRPTLQRHPTRSGPRSLRSTLTGGGVAAPASSLPGMDTYCHIRRQKTRPDVDDARCRVASARYRWIRRELLT